MFGIGPDDVEGWPSFAGLILLASLMVLWVTREWVPFLCMIGVALYFSWVCWKISRGEL